MEYLKQAFLFKFMLTCVTVININQIKIWQPISCNSVVNSVKCSVKTMIRYIKQFCTNNESLPKIDRNIYPNSCECPLNTVNDSSVVSILFNQPSTRVPVLRKNPNCILCRLKLALFSLGASFNWEYAAWGGGGFTYQAEMHRKPNFYNNNNKCLT